MEFDPYNGVAVLVEVGCLSKGFGGEIVFLDLVGPSTEVLVTNVLKQLGLLRSFIKDARMENTLELVFLVMIGAGRSHNQGSLASNPEHSI